MKWTVLVLFADNPDLHGFAGLILTCRGQEHDPENCPMVCNMLRDPLCAENSKGELKSFGSPFCSDSFRKLPY
ncbi:hypothetical protein B566_EDAN013432 [Ephemera danica]|nr:hypothetical protein B566_EDAN013432 [Ephemera danica]